MKAKKGKAIKYTGQSTLFGSPAQVLQKYIDKYPQIHQLAEPKELVREDIRTVMVDLKNEEMKREGYKMYTDEYSITAKELMEEKIWVKGVSARQFLHEHQRSSLAECKGFIQEGYIVYCGDTPIGLINFMISMMRNTERDKLFPEGKGVNDYNGKNIQTCVSYPWAGRFLVGKLLATLACSIAMDDKECGFVETTSLFGKSIQYDRLPFLKMYGTTTGSTGATYIFPHYFFQDLQKSLRTFCKGYLVEDNFFSKKKSLLVALFKLTGLDKKGYKVTNLVIKRGYYLCILNRDIEGFTEKRLPPLGVDGAVEYWRKRWLIKRMGRK